MTAKPNKIRQVVFLAQATVDRYEKLAQQMGYRRAELYRAAICSGFTRAAVWTRRFNDDAAATDEAAERLDDLFSEEDDASAREAAAGLAEFAAVLVRRTPGLGPGKFRQLLKASAAGLDAHQAMRLVDRLTLKFFPKFKIGPAPGAESGSAFAVVGMLDSFAAKLIEQNPEMSAEDFEELVGLWAGAAGLPDERAAEEVRRLVQASFRIR